MDDDAFFDFRERLTRREEAAAVQFVNCFSAAILRRAQLVCWYPGLAEDIRQTVLAELLTRLNWLKPLRTFSDCRNVVLHCTSRRAMDAGDAYRRRRPAASLQHVAEPAARKSSCPAAAVERSEMLQKLQAFLDGLEPIPRTIMLLYLHEDMTFEDIAAQLNLAFPKVRSIYYRHREKLQRALRPEDFPS